MGAITQALGVSSTAFLGASESWIGSGVLICDDGTAASCFTYCVTALAPGKENAWYLSCLPSFKNSVNIHRVVLQDKWALVSLSLFLIFSNSPPRDDQVLILLDVLCSLLSVPAFFEWCNLLTYWYYTNASCLRILHMQHAAVWACGSPKSLTALAVCAIWLVLCLFLMLMTVLFFLLFNSLRANAW